MAGVLELTPELRMVVELAVVSQPHRAILVGHRLIRLRREVDDPQAGVPKHTGRALAGDRSHAASVGSPVVDGIEGMRDRLLPPLGGAPGGDAEDAAHGYQSPFGRRSPTSAATCVRNAS